MTEQEKLDYYELHGHRPPVDYHIHRVSFRTGQTFERLIKQFSTLSDAEDFAKRLANGTDDEGKIVLVFTPMLAELDETVKDSFMMYHRMFFPDGILDDMEIFFEIA